MVTAIENKALVLGENRSLDMELNCITLNVLFLPDFKWGSESRMKFFKSAKQKCERCGVREPTGEDGLCDNCRYLVLLNGFIESRAAA